MAKKKPAFSNALSAANAAPLEVVTQPFEFKDSQPLEIPYVPLNDFVLVRRLEEGETVVGNLIIPDSAKLKSNKGEVLASGPGRIVNGQLFPTGVEQGDVVLFTRYGGTDTDLDGEKFLIVRGAEIYLKLRR